MSASPEAVAAPAPPSPGASSRLKLPPPKGSTRPAIDAITERLWLGPCPRTPEFIRALREDFGIDGLVSVQSDDDLRSMGLDWPLMWRFLMARDIAATRVPITDFDDVSLGSALAEAVAAVQSLHSAGRVTYLHCSIGVHRSSTVAVAWLVRHRGFELEDAIELVLQRRPQVQPNLRVLERWLRQAGATG